MNCEKNLVSFVKEDFGIFGIKFLPFSDGAKEACKLASYYDDGYIYIDKDQLERIDELMFYLELKIIIYDDFKLAIAERNK